MFYLILFILLLLLLNACSETKVTLEPPVVEQPVVVADSSAEAVHIETPVPEPIPFDSLATVKIPELRQRLIDNGVPGEWFDAQMAHESFKIHPEIDRFFQKAAEKKVDHDKEQDAAWYFARLSVDDKIEKGKGFIEHHRDLFEKAEARHGIHKELIAAIIGIETNFADHYQRGKFTAFNSLVSQYIYANRMKFAVREITALYKFSQKTARPPHYFTSSYAGAIGWGQFIPSSLISFFVDAQGIHEDTDPFSLEDTVFSVENYLYQHQLSGTNIHTDDAKYKAVYAYNHSDIYVRAVLYIYEGLQDHFCQLDPETGEAPAESVPDPGKP